jgi:hypothetical protein
MIHPLHPTFMKGKKKNLLLVGGTLVLINLMLTSLGTYISGANELIGATKT